MAPSQQQQLAAPEFGIAKINATLAQVYQHLDSNPAWKSKLDYVVSRKGQAARLQKIFEFQGPDIDTLVLLHQYRETWTTHPMNFALCGLGESATSNHPVLQAALHCLALEQRNAWATMLRRCQCMVLSTLQKLYRMTPEDVAAGLAPIHESYRGEKLATKVKYLLDAGSKYDWLEQQLGRGVTFVLGKTISDDTWEKRLPKFGKQESSQAVLEHLKSTGIIELAAQYRHMRDAIIFFMLTMLLEAAMTSEEAWERARKSVYGEGNMEDVNQMWNHSLHLYPEGEHFNTVAQSFVSTW
ncbi:hypothetical protein MMC13_005903 [Lambiella insularis]|nr:hypothetical protein [Lambiella insularis]